MSDFRFNDERIRPFTDGTVEVDYIIYCTYCGFKLLHNRGSMPSEIYYNFKQKEYFYNSVIPSQAREHLRNCEKSPIYKLGDLCG